MPHIHLSSQRLQELSLLPETNEVYTVSDISIEQSVVVAKANWEGFRFIDCLFPDTQTEATLLERGAEVYKNDKKLPFKQFRGLLYSLPELDNSDEAVFDFCLKQTKQFGVKLAKATHDLSISEALSDYLIGKHVIGFMGGHIMDRNSPSYQQIALLSHSLAQKGFVIITGGNQGAMEAANLGGYLYNKTQKQVLEAIEILKTFCDDEGAEKVKEIFPSSTEAPSIGVPTFEFGREKYNRFVSFHAKFFSNAIREQQLIELANCGIIYSEGSAGTRLEIFQDACRNHYTESDYRPMVFFDKKFWLGNGVFDLLSSVSTGKPFRDLLSCADDIDAIVASFEKFKNEKFIK